MTNKELIDKLAEMDMYDTIIISDGPDCADAVIGFTDKQVVYDYDLLVQRFIDWGLDEQAAIEYVDFNICEAHLGEFEPIIMYKFND